jgi:outer membrane protein
MPWNNPPGVLAGVVLMAAALAAAPDIAVRAETLAEALVRTYQGNPALNAERARQRAIDEGVAQAMAGYRPQVFLGLSAGLEGVRNLLPVGGSQTATLYPWIAGVTVNQTIFNGLKTANTVRQAEARVRTGRETLRGIEQQVLLDAVAAYMTVLANQSLVESQRTNLSFLRELLSTTRKRLEAGDVTPTDVAQAEARTSRGVADLNNAEVNLAVSQAAYLQVIGVPPAGLSPAEPIDRLLPRQREAVLGLARREHPSVLVATFDVDVAQFAVSIAEAGLWPTVSVQGNVSRNYNTDTTLAVTQTDQAYVIGQTNIPLYDGGVAASQVRQAKETLAQIRILLDRVRVRADVAVNAAWVVNEGARISLSAAESEVRAATLALSGVQKEAQAGQRTTLDVLNSQQDLTGARARLITAQKDRVIASYTLLAAIGRLDRPHLALATPDYDPGVHYQQVRDVWKGLRTPSGQ